MNIEAQNYILRSALGLVGSESKEELLSMRDELIRLRASEETSRSGDLAVSLIAINALLFVLRESNNE